MEFGSKVSTGTYEGCEEVGYSHTIHPFPKIEDANFLILPPLVYTLDEATLPSNNSLSSQKWLKHPIKSKLYNKQKLCIDLRVHLSTFEYIW